MYSDDAINQVTIRDNHTNQGEKCLIYSLIKNWKTGNNLNLEFNTVLSKCIKIQFLEKQKSYFTSKIYNNDYL